MPLVPEWDASVWNGIGSEVSEESCNFCSGTYTSKQHIQNSFHNTLYFNKPETIQNFKPNMRFCPAWQKERRPVPSISKTFVTRAMIIVSESLVSKKQSMKQPTLLDCTKSGNVSNTIINIAYKKTALKF